MESSATHRACVFQGANQRHHHHHHHQQHQDHPQSNQFYASCEDVTEEDLMRQMMMMATYQHGGAHHHHDVYVNVLPPGGTRLRHDDAVATPGDRAVNFTHPFSITNIMSAQQQQQHHPHHQQLIVRGSEFDDVKAGEFPFAGEIPAAAGEFPHAPKLCPYNQTRLMPSPCLLQATYEGHVTNRKSTPSLNGGVGFDAHAQYGRVLTTSATETPVQ